MTINKNFKSRPERLKYSKCMNFSLSGLDLKLLFMVTGAYYESGLIRTLRQDYEHYNAMSFSLFYITLYLSVYSSVLFTIFI